MAWWRDNLGLSWALSKQSQWHWVDGLFGKVLLYYSSNDAAVAQFLEVCPWILPDYEKTVNRTGTSPAQFRARDDVGSLQLSVAMAVYLLTGEAHVVETETKKKSQAIRCAWWPVEVELSSAANKHHPSHLWPYIPTGLDILQVVHVKFGRQLSWAASRENTRRRCRHLTATTIDPKTYHSYNGKFNTIYHVRR